MNVREALKALADGHKVVDSDGAVWELDQLDMLCRGEEPDSFSFRDFGPFSLYKEPATDAELVAEMERLASECFHAAPLNSRAMEIARHCANMLRTRKVKP